VSTFCNYVLLKKLFEINDYKTFKVYYLPILMHCDIREYIVCFMYLQYSRNQVLVKLFNVFANHEMHTRVLRYNVPAGYSCNKLKCLIKTHYCKVNVINDLFLYVALSYFANLHISLALVCLFFIICTCICFYLLFAILLPSEAK